MKTFEIIRHGKTALNSEAGGDDRLRGWRNEPLDKEGRAEAKKLARKLKNSNIDVLYHSPLDRAVDTAKMIAKTTGAKLIALEELKPWNVGHLTGTSSAKAAPILAKFCCETPDKAIPGGESFNAFRDRVFKGLRKCMNGGYNKPAIVSHYRIERLLKAYVANGQKPDHSIDEKTFLSKGEETATAEKIDLKV